VLCSTTFQRFKATSTRVRGRCLAGPDYVSTFRDDAVRGLRFDVSRRLAPRDRCERDILRNAS